MIKELLEGKKARQLSEISIGASSGSENIPADTGRKGNELFNSLTDEQKRLLGIVFFDIGAINGNEEDIAYHRDLATGNLQDLFGLDEPYINDEE